MLWEGKKKGKTGGAGELEKATAHFGSFVMIEKFCRDMVSLALGHDKVFRVAIGFYGQAHDPAWALVTGMHARHGRACDSVACARDRVSLTLCRDRDLRIATWSPGRLGGLGRVKTEGFSVATKLFWVLCHDRGLCRDRVWLRPGGLMSQHNTCVSTGWCNGCIPTLVAMRATCAQCAQLPARQTLVRVPYRDLAHGLTHAGVKRQKPVVTDRP